MPITISCPNCTARLEAPDDIEGKKVKCRKCGETFRARPILVDDEDDRPAAQSTSKTSTRPVTDDEDDNEDDRSTRRPGKSSGRREEPDEDDEEEDRPRRSGKAATRSKDEDDEEEDRPRRSGKAASRNTEDDKDDDEEKPRRSGKSAGKQKVDDEDESDEEDRPRRSGKAATRSKDEDEDDEDKPRARKKKRKKKAVQPVVLWSAIGIGALVLIAVLGMIFAGGDDEDGSVPVGGPVTGQGGGGGGEGGGGGAAADQALPGWMEFEDPNGQFKVRVPRAMGAPTRQQWPLPAGEQPAEVTIYNVEIGGALYSVAHLTIPGREPGAPADPILDEAIGGAIGWSRGAVIKNRSKITHQGFPGRQATLEYPNVKGATVARVILAGNRMFWILAKGDNFTIDTPKVRPYLDSLTISK